MKKSVTLFLVSAVVISLLIPQISYGQKTKEVEKTFEIKQENILEANIIGDMGELYLKKGKKDYEGYVYILYDPELFNYDYYFDEEYSELFVSFKKDKLFEGLEGNFDDQSSEVEIFLPRKITTNLDIEIRAGTIDLNLTGIPLKNFHLQSFAGEAIIKFDEQNPVILEYMLVDLNFGEIRIDGLGNANFEDGLIDGGVGHLSVDLTGKYTKGDHYLKIDLDIGELEIYLPKDIGIRMKVSKLPLLGHLSLIRDMDKKGRYYYSENFDDTDIKLYLEVEMGIGECVIR